MEAADKELNKGSDEAYKKFRLSEAGKVGMKKAQQTQKESQ